MLASHENKPILVPPHSKHFFLIQTDEGLISFQDGSPPSSDSGLQLCPPFGSTALEFLALKSRLENVGKARWTLSTSTWSDAHCPTPFRMRCMADQLPGGLGDVDEPMVNTKNLSLPYCLI